MPLSLYDKEMATSAVIRLRSWDCWQVHADTGHRSILRKTTKRLSLVDPLVDVSKTDTYDKNYLVLASNTSKPFVDMTFIPLLMDPKESLVHLAS